MVRQHYRTRIGLLFVGAVLVAILASCQGKSDTKSTATAAGGAGGTLSNASGTANWSDDIAQYRTYTEQQADELVNGTTAFVSALSAGDYARAKTLYATTRMHYESIEPIAEALGDLDPDIDARANDVPEDQWRGFHRIEKALWDGNPKSDLGSYPQQLLDDVRVLRTKLESVEIDVPMLMTGAVDLMNEVATSKITGEEDRYSHTDLYDFAANVAGAEEIFSLLQDNIAAKDPSLAKTIHERFVALDDALAQYKQGDGYVLYTTLTTDQTRALAQKVDALAESLSQMPTALGTAQ